MKKFELTPEQKRKLIIAISPSLFEILNAPGEDLSALINYRVNLAWELLGNEIGFDSETVDITEEENVFTAEEKPVRYNAEYFFSATKYRNGHIDDGDIPDEVDEVNGLKVDLDTGRIEMPDGFAQCPLPLEEFCDGTFTVGEN